MSKDYVDAVMSIKARKAHKYWLQNLDYQNLCPPGPC